MLEGDRNHPPGGDPLPGGLPGPLVGKDRPKIGTIGAGPPAVRPFLHVFRHLISCSQTSYAAGACRDPILWAGDFLSRSGRRNACEYIPLRMG